MSEQMMEQGNRVVIRPSRDADVEAMLAIYRRHIRRGLDEGVDDSDTPEPDDLRERRKNFKSKRFPHIVASIDGTVVGMPMSFYFASGQPIATPSSIRSTCITSISARASEAGCCVG